MESTTLEALEQIMTPVAFPDPPLRSSKVAIIGFASETMGLAPWDDPDCEVWILNMLHGLVPRWDRLFEMHDRATIEQESSEAEELRKAARGGLTHLDVLKAERTRPIYTIKREPDIPCSVPFDLARVTAAVGAGCEKLQRQPYFTSTFAYMLADAAVRIIARRDDPATPEPGEAIHVCGVEMLNGEEYAYQRSCAEFLTGWVLGRGIAVYVPDHSAILSCDGLYGYARAESLELLAHLRAYYEDKRKKQLQKRDEAAMRRDQAKADWNTADGAVQALEHTLNHLVYLVRGGKV